MLKLQRIAATALSIMLVLAVVLASSTALQRSADSRMAVIGTPVSLGEIVVEAQKQIVPQEDILWLARVIYSETKRAHEQELVAWVVRNRVETEYRGKDTYREVVLDRYQFSAFNGGSKRAHYTSLQWNSTAAGFQTALSIANEVANASITERPFSEMTRHFFSRQSMVGGRTPAWANGMRPVALDREVEPDRFRFYAEVA